ncbi:MAG: hypothetical protein NXH72_07025 [Hyphomonadaceae bacterium]|nr:hypothetical protein [Hyphomonadaceae bacterium]
MPDRNLQILMGALSVISLAACGSASDRDTQQPAFSLSDATDSGAQLALACSGCHSAASGAIVSLNGYTREALETRLLQYKSEADGTTVMHRLARGYSDDDIAEVSAALAPLGSAP